ISLFKNIPPPTPVPSVIQIKSLQFIALPLNFSAKATQLPSFSISTVNGTCSSKITFKFFPFKILIPLAASVYTVLISTKPVILIATPDISSNSLHHQTHLHNPYLYQQNQA